MDSRVYCLKTFNRSPFLPSLRPRHSAEPSKRPVGCGGPSGLCAPSPSELLLGKVRAARALGVRFRGARGAVLSSSRLGDGVLCQGGRPSGKTARTAFWWGCPVTQQHSFSSLSCPGLCCPGLWLASPKALLGSGLLTTSLQTRKDENM